MEKFVQDLKTCFAQAGGKPDTEEVKRMFRSYLSNHQDWKEVRDPNNPLKSRFCDSFFFHFYYSFGMLMNVNSALSFEFLTPFAVLLLQ